MDTEKKRLTPEEKVKHLKKRLENAQKAVTKKNRKQRNGWLVSAGIVFEAKYMRAMMEEDEKRDILRKWVDALDAGDDRNRTRFIEFLDHLETEKKTATAAVQKALKQSEPAIVPSATPLEENKINGSVPSPSA